MPYSGDPSDSPQDAIRFLLGDIDNADLLLEDNEVTYLYDEAGDVFRAAADGAERIAAKLAREIDTTAEGNNYRGSQLFAHYNELAVKLRAIADRELRRGVKPYVGGISHNERKKDDADADLIKSYFRSHEHDYPGSGQGGGSHNLRSDT